MKKLILGILATALFTLSSFASGTVTLGWNLYTDNADTIIVYGLFGTNTSFNNTNNVQNGNATISQVVSSTATQASFTNLQSGTWQFVTVASNSITGIYSANSNVTSTNVGLAAPTGLKVLSVTVP